MKNIMVLNNIKKYTQNYQCDSFKLPALVNTQGISKQYDQ